MIGAPLRPGAGEARQRCPNVFACRSGCMRRRASRPCCWPRRLRSRRTRANSAPPTSRRRTIRPSRRCASWTSWSRSAPTGATASGCSIPASSARRARPSSRPASAPSTSTASMSAPIGNFAPVLNVLALPFLFRSIEHLHKVVDGPIGEDILGCARAVRLRRAHLLRFRRPLDLHRAPAGALARRSQRPAHPRPAIRPDGGDVRALGAEPIGAALWPGPAPRCRPISIDGAENNWPSYVSTGHYKAARYYTVTQHTMGPEVLIMSRRAWDELSPEDRTIFRERRARVDALHARAMADLGAAARASRRATPASTSSNRIDRKPFEAATAPLRDAIARRPADSAPLIERIEAER